MYKQQYYSVPIFGQKRRNSKGRGVCTGGIEHRGANEKEEKARRGCGSVSGSGHQVLSKDIKESIRCDMMLSDGTNPVLRCDVAARVSGRQLYPRPGLGKGRLEEMSTPD